MIEKVAFSGKIATGKTSNAKHLEQKFGHTIMYFAAPLKAIANNILEIYRIEKFEEPLHKIIPDIYMSIYMNSIIVSDLVGKDMAMKILNELYINTVTKYSKIDLYKDKSDLHRAMLQEIGAIVREVKSDAWAKYLRDESKLHNRVAVDDLRYKDEYEELKRAGFTIIRIKTDRAIQEERVRRVYPDLHLSRLDHPSETQLDDIKFDYVVDGNQPLDQMFKQVDKIILGG